MPAVTPVSESVPVFFAFAEFTDLAISRCVPAGCSRLRVRLFLYFTFAYACAVGAGTGARGACAFDFDFDNFRSECCPHGIGIARYTCSRGATSQSVPLR